MYERNDEGIGCDLEHSLWVSTLSAAYSQYIPVGYFLYINKYYPEYITFYGILVF